ncbi:AAA ATPase-like protein [Mumia flava]|uniref:AAA ATPase-like protein n=1 Tax=Mumia flava TaxID=1348852 RepID=A0A0B2B704_9ACTN|nr:LuxR C-terminal-related transcriptional regulator [Mumia flava]PJJ57864.1 AAA ATPase-like protein [Mumia flava]
MLLWSDEQLGALTDALERARRATPSALVVEGGPGEGKTSLMAELLERAADFRITTAEGLESDSAPEPFDLLRAWGVALPPGTPDDLAVTSVGALAAHVDELTVDRPLLLVVDDVQWTDHESVDSVRTLLRQLDGTPLLVAVFCRVPSGSTAPRVDGLVRAESRLTRMTLSGLTSDAAVALVARERPTVSPMTAVELWRHTEGNPLFLTSLLRELDPEQLDDLPRALPAPRAFADALGRRLARLDEPARDVLEATVVLSSGWSTVLDVAAVSGRAEPFGAVQELVDAGLVDVRQSGPLSLRCSHALVRAAAQQVIGVPRRRSLHARAATLTGRSDVLDHRIAAAASYDEALAAEVEQYAAAAHRAGAYRRAGHYFRSACALTSEPSRRRTLTARAGWDDVLAGIGPRPHPDEPHAADDADAVATAALEATAARDPRHALDLLETLPGSVLDRAEPLVRYRAHLLAAYLLLLTGAAVDRVDARLAAADAAGVTDPALAQIASPVRGFATARRLGDGPQMAVILGELPEDPAAVPAGGRDLLAWRAIYRVYALHVRTAARDLEVLVDASGRTRDPSALHEQLALARWLSGDWALAAVSAQLSPNRGGPLSLWSVEAGGAALDATRGRFDAADARLEQAITLARRAPWPEGRLMLLVARAVRTHAGGVAPDAVARLAADYPDLESLLAVASPADGLLLLHAGLTGLWTGQTGATETALALLERAREPSRSDRAVIAWLSGQLAGHLGDRGRAVSLLRAAAGDEQNELPLYRAHMLADLADVLEPDHRDDATRARSLARSIYRRLDAVPYVERLAQTRVRRDVTDPSPDPDDYLPPLTDRERDVVALLVQGLSYAQIATRLFVTRSAVAFHLSNTYAKFDVHSRHDLTAYVLDHPSVLTG